MFINVNVERKVIDSIPCLHMFPREQKLHPTLVLYHGWTSNKENQLFLGSILASQGWGVVAVDAPHHGERADIDFTAANTVRQYFWDTVIQSVNESAAVLSAVSQWPETDKTRIGIMGISMGSFIGTAVFLDHPELALFVSFIGTGSWMSAAQGWDPDGHFPTPDQMETIKKRNPALRAEKVLERPVLLLHGDADPVVDVNLQREFFKVLHGVEEGRNVTMVETTGLGHFLELDMIETASRWIKKQW